MSAIAERIRKLLALARDKSASVHEAATAAAMAQRLMARHSIDAATLEEGQSEADRPEEFRARSVYRGEGPMQTWVLEVCSGVVQAASLRGSYWTDKGRSHGYTAYGPSEELEGVEELIRWLLSEVQRLEGAERAKGEKVERSYWNGFRTGAAATIRGRLLSAAQEARTAAVRSASAPTPEDYAQARQADDAEALLDLDRRAAAPPSPAALVRVEAAIERVRTRPKRIGEWQKQRGFELRSSSRHSASNEEGYKAGRAAGHGADLSGGRRRIGGGQ